MNLVRSGDCPNCGAPITFAMGSSVSKVCEHCEFIVVRTDRDLSTLGKVADLVPSMPPFEVNDELTIEGKPARVTGRVQKDYGAGPWDEFAVEMRDGSWAWVAFAQGRWYVTSRVDNVGELPPWHAVKTVGVRGRLGTHPAEWTVAESRQARVLAARGEFPEPFVQDEVGLYIDLVAPEDLFATLDYETPNAPPTLYAGRILPAQSIVLASEALGPRTEHKVTTARLRCTQCGAPIELLSGQKVERIACGACGAVLEPKPGKDGLALKHVSASEPLAAALCMPLGSRGTLRGVDLTLIGAMRRCTLVDGVRYSWLEYLLHSEQGYFWLLEDNGHFTFIRDANLAQYKGDGEQADYQGRKFKAFFRNPVYVMAVAGEFYWKVSVDEKTDVTDYINPPKVLSYEKNAQEAVLSIGEYVEPSEISAAFTDAKLPPRVGVAPAQPAPSRRGPAIAAAVGIALMILLSVLIGKSSRELTNTPLPVLGSTFAAPATAGFGGKGEAPPPDMPVGKGQAAPEAATAPAQEAPNTTITPSFVVDSRTTLRVSLHVVETNISVESECALVNETTGAVREFVIDTGAYSGVSGGESWSEGSHTDSVVLDRVEPGTYSLHVRTTWEGFNGDGGYQPRDTYGNPLPPSASMKVEENERTAVCPMFALFVLLAPLAWTWFRRSSMESKRWENSNLVSHGEDD